MVYLSNGGADALVRPPRASAASPRGGRGLPPLLLVFCVEFRLPLRRFLQPMITDGGQVCSLQCRFPKPLANMQVMVAHCKLQTCPHLSGGADALVRPPRASAASPN